MSKYIPGNQKHLSLDDRKYIERSLNEGTSFKDIARFLCKDPTTISKEIKLHRLSDWYHKGTFYNAHNFCVHRYHCQKRMYVARSFFVTSNVLPVQPVTRPVLLLKRKDATALTKHPTCAMDAPKQSIIVPSPINTVTMRFLPNASTGNAFPLPDLEST